MTTRLPNLEEDKVKEEPVDPDFVVFVNTVTQSINNHKPTSIRPTVHLKVVPTSNVNDDPVIVNIDINRNLNTPDDKHKVMREIGELVKNNDQKLLSVMFVSEAWKSSNPLSPMPSKDPNRIEVAVFAMLNSNGKSQAMVKTIHRAKDSVIQFTETEDDDENYRIMGVENNLLRKIYDAAEGRS